MAAFNLKMETPTCMGSPSFREMEKRIDKHLATLIVMHDFGKLQALKKEAQASQRQVNRKPYSDPEDRCEDFANDYGEDLYKHFDMLQHRVSSAIVVVEKRIADKEAPLFSQADFEGAKKAKQERLAKEKEDMERKTEERRVNVEAKKAMVDKIVQAGRAENCTSESIKDILDSEEVIKVIQRSYDDHVFFNDVGSQVLEQLFYGDLDNGIKPVTSKDLLVTIAQHPACTSSHKLAQTFWELCANRDRRVRIKMKQCEVRDDCVLNASGIEATAELLDYSLLDAEDKTAWINALVSTLAFRFTEPIDVTSIMPDGMKGCSIMNAEGEGAQPQSASNQNRLLHWAAYKSNYGVFSSLMDAYELRASQEAAQGRVFNLSEHLTNFKNKDGQHVLHMVVRASGAEGRAGIPKMLKRVAKYIDPAIESDGEKCNVAKYLERVHTAKFAKEIMLLMDVERGTSS
eukprot:gnl/MRDRNA2_/MRDRNA2_41983_c0_seq1.p1 gnl/MRDRNA2_/MRDRNA2_41983_c0~~gnl/MRDRNA2_/MRDRNA2_41983_c0_seq1.p1  ORF type:complete len:475 (+),score=76.58 gnl/MRDRNA2_/MRDRNA2_41983_c0_seq1:50-1426(+)